MLQRYAVTCTVGRPFRNEGSVLFAKMVIHSRKRVAKITQKSYNITTK